MSASHHSRGLILVAIWKLIEGAALVLLALGAFHLLHRDVGRTLESWVRMAHIDPGNRHLAQALTKAGLVDDHRLKQIGGLTLAYAALFFVEGIGLLREKRWAEYLTVIATASFVPLEVYEVWRHPTPIKMAVLAGNVVVVIYLAAVLRKNGRPTNGATRGEIAS